MGLGCSGHDADSKGKAGAESAECNSSEVHHGFLVKYVGLIPDAFTFAP